MIWDVGDVRGHIRTKLTKMAKRNEISCLYVRKIKMARRRNGVSEECPVMEDGVVWAALGV